MAVESNVDPRKIARVGIGLLEDRVVASNVVTRESFDQFRGNPGRTVETTVPGVLPYREYEWGNDRSEPIKTDSYTESIVSTTIGVKRPYSAVDWTDEQEFDFEGDFGRVANAQMDAVARAVEDYTLGAIAASPFEREISIDNTPANIKTLAEAGRDPFFNAIVDAKSAISKFRVPYTSLVALASNEFADELEKNHKLTLNQGRGDSALANATVGTFAGVTFVRSNIVPAGQAVLFDRSAYVLFTAAPRIPNSVPFGASVSHNGFGLSWLKDYSSGYLEDRSVFHTYAGATYAKDHAARLAPWVDSSDEYFLRGVRLGLQDAVTDRLPGDGKGSTPGSEADSLLAQVWNNTVAPVTPGAGVNWPDFLRHPKAVEPGEG